MTEVERAAPDPLADEALTAARSLAGTGRTAEAIDAFTTLLQRDQRNLAAVLDLGTLLRQQGHARQAVQLYRSFAAQAAAPAELWVNLGNAEASLGEREAAIVSYRQALSLKPDLAVAARYLGRLLLAANRAAEALPFLQQAANAMPRDAVLLEEFARVLRRLERWGDAVTVQKHIAALKPNDPAAEAELARALVSAWQLRAGIAAADHAISRDPNNAVAWLTRAEALARRGMTAESRAAFNRVAALQPDSAHVAQCRLINLLYDDKLNARTKADEHQRMARVWNSLTPSQVLFANAKQPERRLRLGYVTPDLRRHHPVAQFVDSILKNHDLAAVELFLYSTLTTPDPTTQRFKSLPAQWRDLARSDDVQAASMIAADGIDLLVDLCGHTGGSRMGIFARRPAPVQVSYLGYSHSTGLHAMDYIVVDGEVAPPGSEALFTEKLLRLSPSLFCFAAPAEAPPVSQRPADKPIVFGSYNNAAKLSPSAIALWIALLRAVPQAKLRLKAAIFSDSYEAARFTNLFASGGIDASRLDFAPLSPRHEQMLAEFALVDIALDPVPYNGATTTCLALWMGVPVVSLAGEGYSTRMGASLLKTIGQPDWVAGSAEEYIAIAQHLARDRGALQHHRATLRQRMQASPLMDGPSFTRKLEALYRQAWRDWCAL